jgi:hypothetical protein
MDPTMMTVIASVKFDDDTNEPAEITNRPIPKLDHKTKKFLPDNTFCFFSNGFIPKSDEFSKNFITIL